MILNLKINVYVPMFFLVSVLLHSEPSSIRVDMAAVQFSALWKVADAINYYSQKNWSTGENSCPSSFLEILQNFSLDLISKWKIILTCAYFQMFYMIDYGIKYSLLWSSLGICVYQVPDKRLTMKHLKWNLRVSRFVYKFL